MARAALGSSELRADLSAQLAQNSGSAQRLMAPSHTVCNTSFEPIVTTSLARLKVLGVIPTLWFWKLFIVSLLLKKHMAGINIVNILLSNIEGIYNNYKIQSYPSRHVETMGIFRSWVSLVFEGPVWSSFFPLWAQTGTATSSMTFQNYVKLDWTAGNRFVVIQPDSMTSCSWFDYNQSSTDCGWSKLSLCRLNNSILNLKYSSSQAGACEQACR